MSGKTTFILLANTMSTPPTDAFPTGILKELWGMHPERRREDVIILGTLWRLDLNRNKTILNPDVPDPLLNTRF